VQWLWPNLIQKELDKLKTRFNNHKIRFDKNKKLPSGVSPNVAYALPEKYQGRNCLQAVDRDIVRKLMEDIGGEALIQFVSPEYAARAQCVLDSLGLEPVTLANVWVIFQRMIPHMYARI
jgi:hypothetical protein